MSKHMPLAVDSKSKRSLLCRLLLNAILISAILFIGTAFVITECKEKFSEWRVIESIQIASSTKCEHKCRADGSEALPRGIVSKTSDLEMRTLWGPSIQKKSKSPMSLLAMAVGIKQKENVNKIAKKFQSKDFVIMLFHYDGNVDDWKDLEWSNRAIHISAISQTKWWFAKRFLHPDIVSEYAYIFLWDEDLGVENFHADRYLSIIREEGFQISQPAIDSAKSEVHYKITAREKGSKVHRRAYNLRGPGRKCSENSTGPPCTGWVEMMAPVFSRESWRCAWYMIQNDLIHAWGLDFQLGYCAQGDRTANVGIVDSEYVVHYGLPTLGGADKETNTDAGTKKEPTVPSPSNQPNIRKEVRKRSYAELERFKNRWKKAVREDECWKDPFITQ